MPATVLVNNLTVVHQTSNGVVTTFPDVCKTPSGGGPIPLPYPNVAQSTTTSDGSSSVKADGNPMMLKSSAFALSTGDEAGSAMGLVSNKIKGKAYPTMYSFDVKSGRAERLSPDRPDAGQRWLAHQHSPAANMQPGRAITARRDEQEQGPREAKDHETRMEKGGRVLRGRGRAGGEERGIQERTARITIARPGEGGPICGWFPVEMAENGNTY